VGKHLQPFLAIFLSACAETALFSTSDPKSLATIVLSDIDLYKNAEILAI